MRLLAMSGASSLAASCPFHLHWTLYPASYVVQKTSVAVNIDGNLDKSVWQTVPWSAPFRDITGSSTTNADDDGPIYKPAMTRFKALYDDGYLYIAALLDASPDFPTTASYTERNSPIYQLDSDFEVFVDTDGSNHNYKELEVNAINTVWNLMLDKPYRNGGHEHSGRIANPGDDDYYDVSDQATATRVVSGQLDDNVTHHGAVWSVELKWSFRDLLRRSQVEAQRNLQALGSSVTPKPGTFWRINFSRVELQGKVNWTWQKQVVWDPASRSFRGLVDMHLPDAWGYLVFGGDDVSTGKGIDDVELSKSSSGLVGDGTASSNGSDLISIAQSTKRNRDPSWPARLGAMNVYYALEFYFEQHQEYTDDQSRLRIQPAIVLVDALAVDIDLSKEDKKQFVVRVQMKDDGIIVTVRNDRLLTVTLATTDVEGAVASQ